MDNITMGYGAMLFGTALLLQGDIVTANKIVSTVWNVAIVTFINIVTTIHDWFKED